MKYFWKTGARCKVDAQVAGEMFEQLASEGRLTAKDLVNENRDPYAPLHNEFNWNDAEAAELYREDQARYMIRHIEIKHEPEQIQTRAFFNVQLEQPKYEHINVIIADEEKRSALLMMAQKELRSFRQKYSELTALKLVFDAIDNVIGA